MSPSKLEILAYEATSLGPLCLRRRELLSQPGTLVTEITLNHEFLMSSYNTDSERAIATRAIKLHAGDSLRVLVGGLGLGYTARELAENPRVASIEVVEYLPQVIDWLHRGLVPLSQEFLNPASHAAAKVQISQGDIYRQLMEPPADLFDVIVIDVDHSPDDQLGEENTQFYTEAGLLKAKRHLRESGILAVWSYAESSPFSRSLETVFENVRVESIATHNDLVGEEQTDWLFFGFD